MKKGEGEVDFLVYRQNLTLCEFKIPKVGFSTFGYGEIETQVCLRPKSKEQNQQYLYINPTSRPPRSLTQIARRHGSITSHVAFA